MPPSKAILNNIFSFKFTKLLKSLSAISTVNNGRSKSTITIIQNADFVFVPLVDSIVY